MRINGYFLGMSLISLSEYIWNAFLEPSMYWYPYNWMLAGTLTILFFGLSFAKDEKEGIR